MEAVSAFGSQLGKIVTAAVGFVQAFATQVNQTTNVFITVHFWFAMFSLLLAIFLGYRWGVRTAAGRERKVNQ